MAREKVAASVPAGGYLSSRMATGNANCSHHAWENTEEVRCTQPLSPLFTDSMIDGEFIFQSRCPTL